MAEHDPREDDRELGGAAGEAEEGADDDAPAPTPFDNPYFLPIVLFGFALWFIYDGWFNPDMEWIRFNRVLGVMAALLAVYMTADALGRTHPAALPLLLLGFAGWFAYDGLLNDALMPWAAYVNQGAALLCALLAAYLGLQRWRSRAGEAAAEASAGGTGPAGGSRGP